jgi:hypothetical protein
MADTAGTAAVMADTAGTMDHLDPLPHEVLTFESGNLSNVFHVNYGKTGQLPTEFSDYVPYDTTCFSKWSQACAEKDEEAAMKAKKEVEKYFNHHVKHMEARWARNQKKATLLTDYLQLRIECIRQGFPPAVAITSENLSDEDNDILYEGLTEMAKSFQKMVEEQREHQRRKRRRKE